MKNTIDINDKDLKKQIDELTKRFDLLSGPEIRRAQASALNKAGRQVKSHSVKRSAAPLGVSQKLLRPRVKLTNSTAKKQVATIWGGLQGIPLIKLKAKEVGGGVQAGQYLVPDAFIATPTKSPKSRRRGRHVPSSGLIGRSQVFKRKGRSAYPLENQKLNISPEVSKQMRQSADRIMRNDMRRLMQHEYKFRILRKLGLA